LRSVQEGKGSGICTCHDRSVNNYGNKRTERFNAKRLM